MNARLNLPPLTPQQAAQGVYHGSNIVGVSNVVKDTFIPTQESWKGYSTLDAAGNATFDKIMDAKYPKGWLPSWKKGVYSEIVQMSLTHTNQTGQRISPLDAGMLYYVQGGGAGGGSGGSGGGGGGGGGGYSGPVTQTRLTDPDTAEYIVNQSLTQYLGRAASQKESAAFLKALNRHERANPTVTTPTGAAGSVATGGSNAQAYAEEYAQSRKGASEHTAAVDFLNTFLSSLGNPVD
jgi:hypothetical protein